MASTIAFRDRNYGIQGGIINGNVDATFHLPLERQETPPPPSILIPFARDADFVERGTILDKVDQICTARAALVGLGGVGKSQLAIEYAYRTRERSPETWVFWVHASNAARFEQGFRDIADRVKIYGRQDPQANIFKLVHDWLCSSKHRWLLVLDNVDDPRFLLENRTGRQGQTGDASGADLPLREHLPHCDHGSILVTTRNKEAALKLVEQRDIVFVEPMDKAEGIALFEKKLGARVDSDRNSIADLVAELENMPLAIVQAAAYISQRRPRCSLVQYLDEFRRSDHGKTSLLACEAGQLRRDREAKNSIIITWQISFEHLRQTKPSAADLLSLMSFFDRQGIPESLLHNNQKTNRARSHSVRQEKSLKQHLKHLLRRTRSKPAAQQDEVQSNSKEDSFEDDVIALRNLCFISIVEDGATFQMHRLVQLAMRKWLAANGKLEWWKQQFISNLCAAFPTGEYENWPTCQALYAHAKFAMVQQPEEKSSLVEWATLLYRASWYAWRKGDAAEVETLALQSMKARKKALGQEHEDTLESVGMVGLAYKLGGRWEDAEKLQVQMMETFKTKLGADHLKTLRSISNLALTYWNQGRWDEAEALQVQVIEACKTKLGVDHLETLRGIANLASTYLDQGRWDEAEALYLQVVATLKTKLGVDHPETLMSIANLATTYWNQGRLDEAEVLDLQVIEARKTKLGADHPDTLMDIANLATTYWNQGRLDEAEALYVQVMETRKTKLGVDHPETLRTIVNLASTYRGQGRLDEAEALYVQVMETRKTKLGVDHPETLRTIVNLASTYRGQGRIYEAEAIEVQVLETSKTKLGVDHPFTLICMHNLAFTWKAQGRTADAVVLMRQCLQRRQQVLKASHPEVQASLRALGRWETESMNASLI